MARFVVACCDAPGVFETAEHTFNLVAVPVGSLVVGIRFAAIDFVGNDRSGAAPGQPSAEPGTIVSLVSQQFLWRRQGLQQRHGGVAIDALAAAQEKAQRAAFAVDHRVDFGRASAATCAESLVLAPFLPRAERWTLTAVLSMAFS